MRQMNINQVNKVNHALNLPNLDRHADDTTDLRIEGHGVSIRLPFLPTLQHLVFQSKENTGFFKERVKASKQLGLEVKDFGSPIAIFNFLLPSYLLKLSEASVIENDVKLSDFDKTILATPDAPAFCFIYWTTKYQMNFSRLMVRILMNVDQCHVQLISAVDGQVLASSLIDCQLTSQIEDPLPRRIQARSATRDND